MPLFQYEAMDGKGARQKGELTADSRGQAYDQLIRNGWQPLSLEETKSKQVAKSPKSHQKRQNSPQADSFQEKTRAGELRLRKREILIFTEELADLLDSGVRLEAALGVLAGRKEHRNIGMLSAVVREALREGLPFSVSLRKASSSFDELYLNMIKAGEQSGALATILRRQQEQLTLMEELKSKIRGALIYPAFMILAAGALMLVFMTFLVPQMRSLFRQPPPMFILGMRWPMRWSRLRMGLRCLGLLGKQGYSLGNLLMRWCSENKRAI